MAQVLLFYASCYSNLKLLENVNVDTFVVLRTVVPLPTLLIEVMSRTAQSRTPTPCTLHSVHG